jgi:hypothetical protein
MGQMDTSNRRKCIRYKSPAGCHVNILSEENETKGFLIDLSLNGASVEYIFLGSLLPQTDQIDILYEQENFLIHNIPCRFAFDINANDQGYDPVNWRRVGLWFGELSAKQKYNLAYLINHYWGFSTQLLSQPTLESELAPVSMYSNDIFLSRLKLLIVVGKAYLKDYPFGIYRLKAASRNAKEIIDQLEQQKLFRFGGSQSILLKEQILILAEAFSIMRIKSYGKADIENSIEYISDRLTFGKTLTPMDFLKVA